MVSSDEKHVDPDVLHFMQRIRRQRKREYIPWVPAMTRSAHHSHGRPARGSKFSRGLRLYPSISEKRRKDGGGREGYVRSVCSAPAPRANCRSRVWLSGESHLVRCAPAVTLRSIGGRREIGQLEDPRGVLELEKDDISKVKETISITTYITAKHGWHSIGLKRRSDTGLSAMSWRSERPRFLVPSLSTTPATVGDPAEQLKSIRLAINWRTRWRKTYDGVTCVEDSGP